MISKCDIVDNKLCEAFNSNIVDARYKSIITMLEEIRVKMMTRIREKRQYCSKWKTIKKGKMKYTMDLTKEMCSCRLWQISSIPCAHACCVIWHDGSEPDDYLDKYYHSDIYMKAYQYALETINGEHEWKKSSLESLLPPIARKMPSQPKKNRRKSNDEP
ncbi:hypothetical protein DITRI_Ditri19aG0046100 [Diplodiscus trichospermus]